MKVSALDKCKCPAFRFPKGNRQYDLIVSSSLCRAHKVAQIIGSKLNVDIEVSDQWKERGNGPLAGMAFDEALQKYPKEDFVNPYQPLVVSADAGESMCEMYCRAAMAIQGLIRKGPGKYLVVSHGGFLNGVMNVIMGNQALANEPHVIFMFDDLHYADVRYLPKRDLWVLDKFSS